MVAYQHMNRPLLLADQKAAAASAAAAAQQMGAYMGALNQAAAASMAGFMPNPGMGMGAGLLGAGGSMYMGKAGPAGMPGFMPTPTMPGLKATAMAAPRPLGGIGSAVPGRLSGGGCTCILWYWATVTRSVDTC